MKRLTALTLSAVTALGLSFAPAPAAAGDDDLAKMIAGLLAAGIVVSAVKNRKDKKEAARAETQLPRFGSYSDQVITGRLVDPNQQSKASRKAKRHALPAACLRTLETRGRNRNVYAQSCLTRHYRYAQQLPEHCTIRVRTRNKVHNVFGAQCLAQDGWKTASVKR